MATTAVEQNSNTGGFFGFIDRSLGSFFNFKLMSQQLKADQYAATGTTYGVGNETASPTGGFLSDLSWWQMGLLVVGAGVAAWGVSKAFR